jgi:SnoaL-like polyketide cyclase
MRKLALMATVVALFVAGCAKPAPDYAAQYQPLVDTYVAGWNGGPFDDFNNTFTSDFKRTSSGNMSADGIEALEKTMTDLRTAYPDAKVVLDESHYMKDVSFHTWTFTGTNTGPNSDGSAATGKPVSLSGTTLIHYRDGKIADEGVKFDALDWYQQLGFTLTPPAAEATAQ